MADTTEHVVAPLPRNQDQISFQGHWYGTDYDTPAARVVEPPAEYPTHKPYISLEVGGCRLNFWAPADARAVVLALADAIDRFEEVHGE